MNNTELKAALSRLILSPDWQMFVTYIRQNDVSALINELKTTDFEDFKELQMKQYRVRVMEEMLEMPQKIVDGLTDIEHSSNDPYPANIKEVEAMDALESVNGDEK